MSFLWWNLPKDKIIKWKISITKGVKENVSMISDITKQCFQNVMCIYITSGLEWGSDSAPGDAFTVTPKTTS